MGGKRASVVKKEGQPPSVCIKGMEGKALANAFRYSMQNVSEAAKQVYEERFKGAQATHTCTHNSGSGTTQTGGGAEMW